MKDLQGKVAVVTGGASGIGRAVAEAAATAGMQVVLADIEEAALKEADTAMTASGAEVLSVVTDVSVGSSVDELRDKALARFGAVHLVHNNAGVAVGGPLWTVTEADWTWVLGVNLWGVVHGIRAFVPVLLEQGEGHVVNTASLAGLTSPSMLGPYNVTKHAVVTMSETLYRDLEAVGSRVGVSVLCPGFVQTRIAESDRNRPDWAPADPLPQGVEFQGCGPEPRGRGHRTHRRGREGPLRRAPQPLLHHHPRRHPRHGRDSDARHPRRSQPERRPHRLTHLPRTRRPPATDTVPRRATVHSPTPPPRSPHAHLLFLPGQHPLVGRPPDPRHESGAGLLRFRLRLDHDRPGTRGRRLRHVPEGRGQRRRGGTHHG